MTEPNEIDLRQNAVALKLPTFWTSYPTVWFHQTEAQFNLRQITDDSTKYYYVVSALDQATAQRVLSLLQHPPDNGKYTVLKNRLLETFSFSPAERADRLLNMPQLGDQKPSELMDTMLALLGNHHPCFLFNHLFLQRMPEDIRPVLAAQDIDDPRLLAQKADALWLARSAQQGATVFPMFRKQNGTTSVPRRRPTKNDIDTGLCFYHEKFGVKARQCRPPCSFQGNGQAGHRK